MTPKRPVISVHLDDDGRELVVRERAEDGEARERRIPAEHVTWHKAEDIGRERMRQLKSLDTVRGIREVGSYVRVSWDGDNARRGGREGMKDNDVATYEGDVDPVSLWLVESRCEIAKPRRCYLDLEADSRVSLANKEGMRILSWAVVDHETGEEHSEILESEDDEAEERLLKKLVKRLERFDQIAVWEGDWKGGEFDSIVLPARCRRQGVDFDERRWLWLNQLAVWKRMNMHSAESGAEKESFKLEDIAHEQIGEGKEPTPGFVKERFPEKADRGLGAMTWELWEAGGKFRELLLTYNVRDAQLLRKLEGKKGYIALFQALCEVCGIIPITRALLPTVQMDGFMLRLGREKDHRFPTKSFRDEVEEDEEQFRGAFVLHPKSVGGDSRWTDEQAARWRSERGMKNGILRDVHVCDFASLYPSIMRTFNLSGDVVVGWAKTLEEARAQHGHDVCVSPGTDLVTRTDVVGFLPLALAELIRLRKEYAELAASLPPGTTEWQDAMSKSTAYKVAANSFYGAGGSPYSRFNHRDVSEACTQNSVHFLGITAAEAEKRKMVVVYQDSVTSDRILVLRDEKGVQLLTAEEAWSRAHNIILDGAGKERGDINAMALTASGWRPISQIIRHRSGKDTWRISTKHGQTQVTTDHGIMVDGVQMRPQDFVARAAKFTIVDAPDEEPREWIDLLEYVGDFEVVLPYKGRNLARRFMPDGKKNLVLGGWGNDPLRIRRFYRRGSKSFAALLRLIGAYVSDGSASLRGITTCRYLLSFCKADLKLMTQIARDLKVVAPEVEVFGPYWSDTVYVVRSGTAAMSCLFAALCGTGSKEKRFPPFIYELDDSGYQEIVAALEAGDGWVDPSGQLVFTTTSAKLASGVSYLLSQRQVEHSFMFRESKGAWIIRTRPAGTERKRYTIKSERFEPRAGEWVYDLSVEGDHTFCDGIGRVLLHNTDSCFAMRPSEDGYRKFVEWLNTKRFPAEVAGFGCRENHVKLTFEKTFSRLVFVSAKAYVGRYLQYKGTRAKADSEPEIKGLAWKRGDKGRLARELQGRIIDCLVGGVKLRVPGGEKLWINRDLGIETPTEDLDVYRGIINRTRAHVLEDPLPLDEVRFSRSLSKSLREYPKNATEVHVRVARTLKAREQVVGKGSRIEFVIIDAEVTPQLAIPAEDYTGECDRFYLWERVYSPTKALLTAAFPDQAKEWETLGKVRPPKAKKTKEHPNQLGLALEARRVDTHDELAVPAYRATPLTIRIPEDAGQEAIGKVLAIMKAHPGARTVTIRILLRSGAEAIVPTALRVSPGPLFKEEIEEAIAPAS